MEAGRGRLHFRSRARAGHDTNDNTGSGPGPRSCPAIHVSNPFRKRAPFEKRLAKYEDVLIRRTKRGTEDGPPPKNGPEDERRRLFLKGALVMVAGFFATTLFPKRAEALVMGSSPGTSVLGVRDASNARINPARLEGNSVLKKTAVLSSSGAVHTPSSGKKLRVYNTKFSLDATLTSVSFRFASGGTDVEKYLAPRAGGLYGTNQHPNYVEGGTNEAFYCAISGSGNVQVNIDYLEV